MIKKKIIPKKIQPKSSKADVLQQILDDAQGKRYVTYESIIETAERHKFTESETSNLLKELEKKNIDLVMQKELDDSHEQDDHDLLESEEAEPVKIRAKISTSAIHDEDMDDAEKDDVEQQRGAAADIPQIADGVKCYLRDIGKIPLLNKKTEKIIGETEKLKSGLMQKFLTKGIDNAKFKKTKLGVASVQRLFQALPHEENDIPMDGMLTANGIIWFNGER